MTVASARTEYRELLRRLTERTGTQAQTVLLAAALVMIARAEGQRDISASVEVGQSPSRSVSLRIDERTPWIGLLTELQGLLGHGLPPNQENEATPVVELWLATDTAPTPPSPTFTVVAEDGAGAPLVALGLPNTIPVTLDEFRRGLSTLVLAITGDVNSRPDAVPALSDEQQSLVLGRWNDTRREYPAVPMQAAFEAHVRHKPHAVAVVQGDHAITYQALNHRAEAWARRLAAAGAGPERIVGVHLGRSADLVAVMLGILKTGAAYLPLDPEYPADRIRFMALDADLVALVSDGAAGIGLDRPVLGAEDPVPESRPEVEISPAATAYVLYTSGSSGRPKGVTITHANATDLLGWSAERFGAELHRVLATTSICFDCSILEIFGPLSSGGTAVIADGALAVGSVSVGHDVALLHTVPSVMSELMSIGGLPASVSTVLLGGEAPWPSLVDDIYRDSGVRELVNVYGPTECTSYATTAVISAGSEGTPPIGRPVANTQVRLVNEYGGLTPIGAPGEIHIGGHGVARGYLRRPGLTAERFAPDPFGTGARVYRTGDLARQNPSGELTFLGRADAQVKVRGVRVEPAEVEQALLRHPHVLEAVVSAPVGATGRVRLSAVVVLAPESPENPDELRDFAGSVLPHALVPDTIVVLPRLPRTPNGKIDRAALRRDPRELGDGDGGPACSVEPFNGPRDELEQLIAAAWAEALRLPRIGRHDDFYAYGGHSLSAMRIRARLGDALGVEIPVLMVFQLRTVADLADSLRPLISAAEGARPRQPAQVDQNNAHNAERTLSANQRSVLARVAAGRDPTLNLPLCVRLTGGFNPLALVQALTEMVLRHEILRTTPKDTAAGWLNPATLAELPLVDLSGLPLDVAERCAELAAVAAAQAPFDLTASPIVHATLFRLGPCDHVLSVVLHQFGGDVWSMEGVGRKLITLYRAATTMTRPDVPEPEVQYADWAADQQAQLASAEGQAHRDWWHRNLAGVPVLALPLRGPRLHAADSTAHALDFRLEPALLETLTALGRRHGATLYMVLLAAFRLRLGAWSGQPDLAIGCPTTGRPHPQLFTTIGSFVNAIVMRSQITDDPTFRDLVRRTRDTALAGYAHQDTPFAQLVSDLDADRDPGRHPLYQASIALHYPNLLVPAPIGLYVDDFGQRPAPHTALDVDLTVYVDGLGATAALTYRTDLFDDTDASRFVADFVRLLEDAGAEPDRKISSLGMPRA